MVKPSWLPFVATCALSVCLGQTHDPLASSSSNRGKLAFLVPNLFGPLGLTLPNPDHEAHFDSAFQANFGPFNTAIATQLTSLPLPSPAAGFTYSIDPNLGTVTRSAQSFGPILAERAETIGKGKMFFGFGYQNFRFNSLDGIKLDNVPAVFEHIQTTPDPEVRKDVITTQNFLDIHIGQTTAFFTYGLTDRMDISVALPFIAARLDAESNATVQRIGTRNDASIHYFLDQYGNRTNRAEFGASGTASGLGDVLLRFKGTALKTDIAWLAFGADLRMPTGDPYDFLGSGAWGAKPFAAVSFRAKRVSPHLNIGYQWNGSSVLAGDIRTRQKAHLPNQITYAAGFDAGISQKLTFAFDVLGQHIPKAQRAIRGTFTAQNGATFPQVAFARDSSTINNAAAGIKLNPISTLLVSFNVIVQMNDAGLRDPVTPLIGLAYTF